MTRSVLWDSSAILALLDPHDRNHEQARSVASRLASEGRPGVVTNYLEAEAHGLLLSRLGSRLARRWLFSNALDVLHAAPDEAERAKKIVAVYADKDWSLCDAISFAVMEARGVKTVFTFDHHFRQYGRFDVFGA